jgi:crotonobetainyl-CoA:carnitine CoA-transferase CaiB-like acyl-CoA transferase
MLDFQAARWTMGREIPPQAGNDHPTGIPTGVFKTKDGHMNIAAAGQLMYQRLCTALGVPQLIDDPRFKTVADRSTNRKAMNEELDRATAARTSGEWIAILNEAGVSCGPIYDVKEVFDDPHVRHLGLAVEVKSGALGQIQIQNVPVTLSRTPAQVRTAAPEMGEHTDEVLREAGYSAEEIAKFRKDEVV